MDHKRALDNDLGLNTGGMGTVAPNPAYTSEVAKKCMEKIFLPTVDFMNREGRPFKGCLYFGLMIREDGEPFVIEYNCRFGDPETQVVLPLLDADLPDIMEAIWQERLSELPICIKPGAAACVVLSSGGYPEKYETGFEITGLEHAGAMEGVTVYHAGTKERDGKIVTSGGRVLGVTAVGESLGEAVRKAYAAAEKIRFEGCHLRKDIGKKALGGNF